MESRTQGRQRVLTRNAANHRFALRGFVVVMFLAAMLILAPTLILAQEKSTAPTDPATDEDSPRPTLFNTNPTQRLISPRQDQTEEQQLTDQLACYDWTSDQIAWDPYQGYTDLVDRGYAEALTRAEMERGLVDLAARGAEVGAIAGDIIDYPGRGAQLGVAISIALAMFHSDYLNASNDPDAQRAVSRFERNLRKWNKKYSGCLVRKGYKVSSPLSP